MNFYSYRRVNDYAAKGIVYDANMIEIEMKTDLPHIVLSWMSGQMISREREFSNPLPIAPAQPVSPPKPEPEAKAPTPVKAPAKKKPKPKPKAKPKAHAAAEKTAAQSMVAVAEKRKRGRPRKVA